ncbi:cysteine dioxygenase [Streptomyces sp. NPDC001858]
MPASGTASRRVGSLAGEVSGILKASRDAGRAVTEDAVGQVAQAVKRHLVFPDLLTPRERAGDPAGYRQHLLYVDPRGEFSIVCLVWLPGQQTPIHDHISWCVTGVYEGRECEQRYAYAGGGDSTWLALTTTSVSSAGEVDWLLPPGDIHFVRNPGPETAISIHVYGADVTRNAGTSIRRVYAQ